MMTTNEEIKTLLGYDVETEQTVDGKFVVLYMNFNSKPPPKGDTEEEALTNFLTWVKENTDGRANPVGDTSNSPDSTVN